MRKLVITQNITLDGSIEMLTSWFDPTAQTPDLLEETHRQDAEADAMLLGRRTFQDFRGYWPQQTDDTTGITGYLNAVDKYVVSSTISDPEWANSTVLTGGDLRGQVLDLKERDGRDIVATGSIQLTHSLIEAGLVDEYRLFVYPAVQGRGRRLFPENLEIPQLTHIGSASFSNGVVLSTYAAA
ncbi:dihydrofolate reductase family protein [Nocardia sp. NPDC019395]|uniref:dihydrofolate reductase family protein n=1 Tax=Nocardia sp. NPDC019395 TaxID=3154686 RepID=UPI0033DBBE30